MNSHQDPFQDTHTAYPVHTYANIPHRRPYRRRSFFWPIVLIGFGVLLLLSNLGLVPATGWAILWRFWPVALIALGVDVMVGHRSLVGAIASAVIILLLVGTAIGITLFADQLPALMGLLRTTPLQSESIAYPLTGIETAAVTLHWASPPGHLQALQDSQNLIEGNVDYRGRLAFDVTVEGAHATVVLESYLQGVSYGAFRFDDLDAAWTVGLSPDVLLDLHLDSASGPCSYDLSALNVRSLTAELGSGSVILVLPERSSFQGEIKGGSGSLSVITPPEVGIRLTFRSGSAGFQPGDRLELVSGSRDGTSVWETPDFSAAQHRIELFITQGSGAVQFR